MTELPQLTPDEARRVRLAIIFGDPGAEGASDPRLELAKDKLKQIEDSAKLSVEL